MPFINLLIFSGNIKESIIHENKFIDDARKMYYLKYIVAGQAADVIASLTSTGQNYIEAWILLKNRYDNKRLIRQLYIQLI